MADRDDYNTNNIFGQKPAKKEAAEAAILADEAILNTQDNKLIVALKLNFIRRTELPPCINVSVI